jgi:hypothetical protein
MKRSSSSGEQSRDPIYFFSKNNFCWSSTFDLSKDKSKLFGWIDLDLEVLAASFVSALEPLSVPIPKLNVDDQQKLFLLKNKWDIPSSFVFPLTDIRVTKRHFNRSWLEKYQWLRYSVSKNNFCWSSTFDLPKARSKLFGWIDLDLELLAASSFVSALEPLSVPIP